MRRLGFKILSQNKECLVIERMRLRNFGTTITYFDFSSYYSIEFLPIARILLTIHDVFEESSKIIKIFAILIDLSSFLEIYFIAFFDDFADVIVELDFLALEGLVVLATEKHEVPYCFFYLFRSELFLLITAKVDIMKNIVYSVFY